jgi:sugar lactone lactonase YvrE
MSTSRRRKQKGRKSRKNEFLPFFKTVYALKQSGGSTIWTTAGSYSVTSITGATTDSRCIPGGSASYGNDGTNKTSVLYDPGNIAIDSVGNIYVNQHSGDVRIRKMDPEGNVTSLVKSGNPSNGNIITGAYSTSNTGSAAVYQCRYLCVDKSTDIIYFSDYSYHYIRMMVGNSGTPTAVSGKPMPTGGSNPYPAGGVTSFVANNGNSSVDGNQDNCKFNHPAICAFDSSTRRLYISDDLCIRMVDIGYGPERTGGPGGGTRVGPSANDRAYVSSLYAPIAGVKGMVVDLSGNLFITMENKHSLWKITTPPFGYTMNVNINNNNSGGSKLLSQYPASTVTAGGFAGNDDSSGYSDNAVGKNARFNTPLGLACDSKNNIYVADSKNNLVRMVQPNGAVCTVAGVQGQSTNLTDIVKFGDGINTMAKFSTPISVAVDATDSIFVLDRGASDGACAPFSRIRKIQRLPPPTAPDPFTLVYTDSISATFTWGAALTGGEPDFPAGFYFLVKTAENPTDTRVDIHPIASGSTSLTVPNQLLQRNKVGSSEQQGFYIKNTISVPLRQNTTYTSVTLVAYNNSGEKPSKPITTPIVIKPASTTYTILKCGKVGTSGYANAGALFSQFNSLKGVAMDKENKVYVVDSGNHCIRVINTIGDSSLFFGAASPGMTPTSGNTVTALNSPSHLLFSYSGAFPLYVADTGNNRILSITAQGVATVLAITSATPSTLTLASPTSMAIDPEGNLYVTSSAKHCIYKITPQGVLSLFGGIVGTSGSADGPGTADVFNTPTGIVYDNYGKCLYVADTGNHLIRKILFDTVNTVCTLAGSQGQGGMVNGLGSVARFNTPTEVAVDEEGNVYVTDRSNHCIRRITIAGLVSTFSGTEGAPGFADGSCIPNAYNVIKSTVKYNAPVGICRSTSGLFFITDSANGCVRCISPNPAPTKPTSVKLTAVTKNSATISWSGDTGASFYAYSISPMSESIVLPTSTSSPATFTGLLDSTAYSLSLIVGNTAGAVFPDPIPCITQIDPDNFVLTVPSTKSMAGIGNIKSIVTANLSWTGATTANIVQYSINPAQTDGKTAGTFPANQKSPYTITNLESGKNYSITLTATINNVPTTATQSETSYTVTSSPVNFTTQTPATTKVATIAGVAGKVSDNTTATATPNNKPLTVPIKDMRGITLGKNGDMFVSSGTCIVKLTPPPNTIKNYLFDTTLSNPTPILVTPNPINATNGSTISLSAGNPTSNGAPGSNSGNNIRFYNISALSYDRTLDCIYVSDPVFHVITKLTFHANGTPITENIAGNPGNGSFADGALGTNRLNQQKGVSVGPDGSLFIADYGNNKVRRLSGGVLSTISDGTFDNSQPSDVTVWPDGSVFVTCSAHHCIRRLVPSTTTPIKYTSSVYAGSSGSSGSDDGALTSARFRYPQGIASDANYNIYVVDSQNYSVRQITGGTVLTIAGTGAGNVDGNASDAKFNFTADDTGQNTYAGIHADNFGNVYVTDYRNGTVRLISTSAATITEAQLENYKASAAIQLQASSAQQQRASAALFESIRASSAHQQADSAARKVRDSSAVQQRASSAVEQAASSARQQVDSSARQQMDSSARRVRDSSAVQQAASSATLQAALSGPVGIKDGILGVTKTIQADITAKTAIVYSQTSSKADKDAAKLAIQSQLGVLASRLFELEMASTSIFAIAPDYQDRAAQQVVPDHYLESIGLTKLYDSMRKDYIVINAKGNIVRNPDEPDNRPVTLQKGGAFTLLPTDVELVGDLTIPVDGQWKSYFDTLNRRYFYVNNTTKEEQYEHPSPPVLSSAHSVVTDSTVKFLPSGWVKLQSTTPNVPYYFNATRAELSWLHPAPPPSPLGLQRVEDATLNPPYEKYMAPVSGHPFYVHGITREAQWNFPDFAFNAGPSNAIRASSAAAQQASAARESSATQQQASSAQRQSASSAQQQRASSAQRQSASSAQQQRASSAQQQSASSAQQQALLQAPVALTNQIKETLVPLKTDAADIVKTLYSPGGDTLENRALLKEKISLIQAGQRELTNAGDTILAIDPNYQDTQLQTVIEDRRLALLGIRKVFDILRNKYIHLDVNNRIVAEPQVGLQGGGESKNRVTRKKSAAN